MFEQAAKNSEAMRETRKGVLMPALCGCRDCGVRRMVTAPGPVTCAECGTAMTILDPQAGKNR